MWTELQTSTTISKMLGDEAVCHPSDKSYLEALAEAYKNAKAWDTRRQVLSVMAGIASYKAISVHIPGLTPYRYTMANLHRLQHRVEQFLYQVKTPRGYELIGGS